MSVLLQKGIEYEIIVTDDGSINNFFADIMEVFEKCKFDRYKLFASDKNRGTCENIFRGIRKAEGEYLKLLSPGDYMYGEHTLAELYMYFRENNVEVGFGEAVYYSDDSNGVRIHRLPGHPCNINPYKCLKTKEKKAYLLKVNYLVLSDFALGAAFFSKTDITERYLRRIVGKVRYAEDNIYRLMVLDGILPHYFPEKIIWYEYGTGISTSGEREWKRRLKKDISAANTVILRGSCGRDWFSQRYRCLLSLGRWPGKIMKYFLFPEAILCMAEKFFSPSYTDVPANVRFYEWMERMQG